MEWYSWLAQEEQFSDAIQTVRAQNLPPLEADRLIHDIFFPRLDVDSMKLKELRTTEFRFVADRREWNTRGRLIPVPTPTKAELEFIPVESYFTMEEREINEHITTAQGDQATIRRLIGASIGPRLDGLVRANQRRLELDALRAWSLGTVTVNNPQTGAQYTASFDFDTARYQTATTAWDDPGENAWNEFLAWIEEGQDVVPGGIRGVVVRKNQYSAIQADAPQGALARPLTRSEFEDLLANQLGFRVQFIILENWLDEFLGPGFTSVRRRVWPSGIMAAVPNRTSVGNMCYAPVVRAFELANLHPESKIDVRGMAVYKEISGNGRQLTHECQVNAFPVPEEPYLWVMDTGIVSSDTA